MTAKSLILKLNYKTHFNQIGSMLTLLSFFWREFKNLNYLT